MSGSANKSNRKGMMLRPQDRPTRQCHAVTLAQTPSGLVAAWFGERKASCQGSGIWLMRQIDAGWTAPVEVVNSTSHGDEELPCWNPVLSQHSSGDLLLFYKLGPSPQTWQGWLTRSVDHGQSWQRPQALGCGPFGPLLGPTKNKPLELADGSLLCPSSSESQGWQVHMESSRDLLHWHRGAPIADPLKLGAIQPCLLTLPGGRLLALCRTRRQVIARSVSDDGGQSWSALAPTALPNPNSGIDATTLVDGRLLLVYNDSTRQRTPLLVTLSDDGENWHPLLTLEAGAGEFSYPSVIQSSDGLVHVAYSWRRQGIAHAVIDLAHTPVHTNAVSVLP
jgi:predicted neuraminidase